METVHTVFGGPYEHQELRPERGALSQSYLDANDDTPIQAYEMRKLTSEFGFKMFVDEWYIFPLSSTHRACGALVYLWHTCGSMIFQGRIGKSYGVMRALQDLCSLKSKIGKNSGVKRTRIYTNVL